MRSISLAATMLALWLQWSPHLRQCSVMLGLARAAFERGILAPNPSRVLALGILVLAPVMLPALGYASPPDPSWIPGLYDDGDFDDIVARTTSATGDTALCNSAELQANLPLVANLPPAVERGACRLLAPAPHPRAPPAL